MNRRRTLLVTALGIMVAIASLGQQKPDLRGDLLVLEWAKKATDEAPPVAVLIEMGLKDAQPKSWSGKATVTGAKVVHREGYRFRKDDMLTEPDGWQASSHRPLRSPAGVMPKAVAIILDPVATIGVVLHLKDIQPDATLSLNIPEQEIKDLKVSLKEVLAGKTQSLENGRLAVRRISTTVPAYTAPTEDDFPAAAYGPDGTLWLAWIAYHNQEENRRIEPPQLKEQPKDFKNYFHDGYHDQLLVKYYRHGKWSNPFAVTDANQDLMRCALAVDKDGLAWVVYSAQRQGRFQIFARALNLHTPEAVSHPVPRMGPELQLTRAEANALIPVLANRPDGSLLLGFQQWTAAGKAQIALQVQKEGRWRDWDVPHHAFSSSEANSWHPSLATGPMGQMAVAGDIYTQGDADIHVVELVDKPRVQRVATSSRFEARPSLAYDLKGRLWVAYEEGPELWGKDFGALVQDDGNPLYFARTIKVVCLEDGKLMRPVAELPPLGPRTGSPDTGQKIEALPRYAYPRIGIDGKGRVWLTYRQKFGTRYTTHPGSYWLTMARRLDGERWTDPIEVHHSDGLLDDRPVLLPHPAGGLRILHNTDHRYTNPEIINNNLYMSYVDLPGALVEPKLVPHDPGQKDPQLVERARREAEAVAAIRKYRVEAGGKKYQLLRGEFHRHTEISWDGGPDGSLEDMWRYGIDAAAMDWIGNGDHDNGAGREYSWWLTQKTTDAYHVPGRFTPMFTYERSVSYPHGHRNCMFAQRGVRTLPRLAEPDKEKAVAGIHADDTKMLYRYLKELGGICAVHTSATSMGTDWRDNDPIAEPIVEIYQGDRMSYEKEEAPRAGYDPKSGKQPANIAGWFPKGFINHALDRGYRLGFQASSDHFSTHISYCIVLAERHDRQAILDGLRQRRCYGATDDIILDVKSGDYLMGDAFATKEPPTLRIKVVGTAPLAKVEVLKDSDVVHTFTSDKPEFTGTWTDPKPTAGVHYYYVRVQQANGELAWGSPLWIEFGK